MVFPRLTSSSHIAHCLRCQADSCGFSQLNFCISLCVISWWSLFFKGNYSQSLLMHFFFNLCFHLWVACSTYPRLLRTKIIHHEFLDLWPREAPIIDSVLYPKHTSWLIIVKWFLKLKVLRWYRRWYLSNLIYDQPTRLGEMCTKEKTEKMRHSFFSPFKDLLANQISKSFLLDIHNLRLPKYFFRWHWGAWERGRGSF